MRTLMLALLMVNLVYALWAGLRPMPVPADIAAEDSSREALVLLDEIERPALAVDQVPGGTPAACLALGPFVSELTLRAFAEAHLVGQTWRLDVEELALPPMYRVYVPSSAANVGDPPLLASVRGVIAGAGLDIDSYLVIGGVLDNAVSLGLFAEQANALNVREQIAARGIAVEMQPDLRTRNLYSIVIAADEDSDFIQEAASALQAFEAEAGVTEKLCETIALLD
jgi:hypothetical protein